LLMIRREKEVLRQGLELKRDDLDTASYFLK